VIPLVETRDVGSVRVLTLSSGRINALDLESLSELTNAVHNAEKGGPRALVLTGAGHVFSAGVDLRRVLEGGRAYTDRLIPALSAAFHAVFAFPGPTVAAINGAAIAGGCVLACACDHRLIDRDAPIGATELRVGVPFPTAALEILRYACTDQAENVILDGGLYRGADALTHRLANMIVDQDLLARAIEVAAGLCAMPAVAYSHTKAQLRGPVIDRIVAASEVDDDVRRMWGSSETMIAIRAHMDRLGRRHR
jgi:enoyl-CoA hydratase/carnithine racemase